MHGFHNERDFANMLTEFATVATKPGSTSLLKECSSSCGGSARGTAIVYRACQWNALLCSAAALDARAAKGLLTTANDLRFPAWTANESVGDIVRLADSLELPDFMQLVKATLVTHAPWRKPYICSPKPTVNKKK